MSNQEVGVSNEISPSKIDQVQAGLDLLAKYLSQLDGKQPDSSILKLIGDLRSFVDALAVAEDEQSQQTKQLLASQQEVDLARKRYEELFSFAPNGYLVTNPKGVILEANRQAAAILNTNHQFLINMPLSVYILKEHWRIYLELLSQCRKIAQELKEVEPSKICFEDQELKLKPLRSDPIIVLVSTAVAYERDTLVLRWSIRDITSQRLAQEALGESEMKFRNLAETTAGAILIVQDGLILYANQALCRILGLPLRVLLNQPFDVYMHPADQWVFHQWTNRAALDSSKQPQFAESAAFRKEIRLLSSDGQECWVDLTAGKLQLQEKLAWVITAFDIDARVRSDRIRTELLHRLVSAQEEDRRRIARELHDQAGQMISAINLGLKSLDGALPGEAEAKLASLRGLVNDLSLGIQHLALDLRPSALDDLGLPVALADYLEGWSQHSQIAMDFQCNITRDFQIPSDDKIAIYRIIQEALTNIHKHAQARNVSVILDQHSQQLIVVVEDDGKGFDLDEFQNSPQAKKHLGLVGMRERAELVGGRLDVESIPGKGTSIFIHVPVRESTGMERSHGENPDPAGG